MPIIFPQFTIYPDYCKGGFVPNAVANPQLGAFRRKLLLLTIDY
ncbi:MAG: hypothetical protein QNJ68_18020 [Microcoleaceae cyanobacterium MO_207.B10]|nr:hypothetical protein [Microcoleaceae cyanobacterium MO_207.B10]